jgi:DNA-binding beta-propeller fold protein YncE
MRIRFAWIAAVLTLISMAILTACSTKYSATSNGLVVVPSQAGGVQTVEGPVMQTFSLNLSNGSISDINNVNGPPVTGLPSSVILDPAGAYAYVATTVDCTPTLPPNTSLTSAVQGAILAYPIAADGKLGASNPAMYLTGNSSYPGSFPTCGLDDSTNPNAGNQIAGMAIDSAGKFLFVAIAPGGATFTTGTNTATPTSTTAALPSPGIAVYAIGSNGGLTQVTGSPFAVQSTALTLAPSPSALAVTSTTFPAQYAPCSVVAPPSTEYLYVADSINNMLLNYAVSASGTLSLATTGTNPIPTGTLPSGVAVDPCNRFVYVSNTNSNNVSAYTVCTVITAACTAADYSLTPVSGSPYTVGDLPGPISEDAYGGFLYVVDTGSNQISEFRIGSANGSLTSIGGPIATGIGPNSIAVRKDDSFLFVANITAATVSDFAITPATGNLTLVTAFQTFNLPSGVAVK